MGVVYDVLASFTCPRTITFVDYRLGFTHKAIVVAIFAYVCFNLFHGQLYLVDSVPLGLISAWSTSEYSGNLGNASFATARDHFYERFERASQHSPSSQFAYCNNPNYDYYYDVNYDYKDIGCAFADEAELSVKGESQLFFSTLVQRQTVAYLPEPADGSECTRALFESDPDFTDVDCPPGATISAALGSCYCRMKSNEFLAAAENMTVNVEHKFEALYGSGEMPRTFVRRPGDNTNLHEFPPGSPVSIPLFKILEWLDMSLDHAAEGKGKQPRLRVKGLQITMKLQYYNYHQAPGMEDQVNGEPGETVCVLEFSPQDMWATLGNSVAHIPAQGLAGKGGFVNRYQYGIKVVIQASGVISTVDFMYLINSVIQGLVLLNVAVVITQQIAYYALGDRSKMYKEFGNETAIFEREAARFAIQSIVAGYVFQILDQDSSGSIDQREIYEAIKERVKGSGLTDEELNTLAGFVIHQAELDGEKHGEERTEKGTIGLDAWDNLFASGFMDFHSLSRVVKNLSKEESSYLLQRAKTFVRGQGGTQYGAV
jgi:hypothetical protein